MTTAKPLPLTTTVSRFANVGDDITHTALRSIVRFSYKGLPVPAVDQCDSIERAVALAATRGPETAYVVSLRNVASHSPQGLQDYLRPLADVAEGPILVWSSQVSDKGRLTFSSAFGFKEIPHFPKSESSGEFAQYLRSLGVKE